LDTWHFLWNGHSYRGAFAFVALPGGNEGLIDIVPLDSYLYGITETEVSTAWPGEVQRAQAILARTYISHRIGADKPYDIVASEKYQNYGGIESESIERRSAVDTTAGRIVTYEKSPALVAFSACCGGRTADPADLGTSGTPYLQSFPDPHCVGTRYHHWKVRVPYAALARRLDLEQIGTLHSVELRNFGNGLRPGQLSFVGSAATIEIETAAFRTAADSKTVRSTFLHSVAPAGEDLTVAGNGFGHGVGMCQWGARVMAAAGASASEIIAFYFPKTALN
jgi:stage II sporulation protein D